MRPLKLEIENIGPFIGRNELDFTQLGDIFLVCGKTGSGKSTLFDCICYALYGDLPGGRKNLVRKLRSDFAPPHEPSSVALDFLLGERRYRIERTPQYQRVKARGTGLAEQPEEAILFEYRDGKLTQLNALKSEADRQLQDLIGLSAEEFSKIVLLPQGEFAQFLRMKTSERRAVLAKLFPVEDAIRVREFVSARAKELGSQLKEAENAVNERLGFYNPQTFKDESEALETEIATVGRELASLETALEEHAATLARAEQAARIRQEASDRLRSAQTEADALTAREAEMRELETRLKLARAAELLAPKVTLEREHRAAQDACIEAVSVASTAQESARERANQAEETAAMLPAREKELEETKRRLANLSEAAEMERELGAARLHIQKLEQDRRALQQERMRLSSSMQRLLARQQELGTAAERQETLLKSLELERSRKDELVGLKSQAEQNDRLNAQLRELGAAQEAREAELARLEQSLPVLEAELQEKESLKERTRVVGVAASLALALRPGTPCPVCGSLEHPAPAAAVPLDYSLDDRIKALQLARDQALASRAAASDALKNSRVQKTLLEKEAAKLLETARPLLQAETAIPTLLEMQSRLSLQAQRLNELVNAEKEARTAAKEIQELYRNIESERQKDAQAATQEARAAAELAALAATLQERQDRYERLRAQSPTVGADTASGSALELLTQEEARREELEAGIEGIRTESDAARLALATAEANLRHALEQREEVARKLKAASAELAAGIATSPFEDLDAWEAAQLGSDQLATYTDELETWRTAIHQAKARIAEAGRALEQNEQKNDRAPADADALRSQVEQIRGSREEAKQKLNTSTARLQELRSRKEDWESADKRRQTLAVETLRIATLANDLSGKNPKKKAFDAWLLGQYLAEVALFATRRLERMSEGRYRLILDDEREGGQGQAGLDLAVFDAYTGKMRPCATLSGGESFMASISLALGLADSIQSRSGGIRLDAVFIDEGFGSLDEESLDQAMTILDEIRDQRMVALISHVADMKARIPARVMVEKSMTGSRLRIDL